MPYIPRLIDPLLDELIKHEPAVMVVGPRACGKTTSARRLARTTVQMDNPQVSRAVAADPDAALQGDAEPILLDEWQFAPDVLGAVKRLVDDDSRSGRFIVTGSVPAETSTAAWPLVGRASRVRMWGCTPGQSARCCGVSGVSASWNVARCDCAFHWNLA